MRRIIYLLYYIRNFDKVKFKRFSAAAKSETARSLLSIWADAVYSSVKYNTSLLDYFYFRFYKLPAEERSKWAGTGFMYEYQLIMNPKETREILENKILFLDRYRAFTKRDFASFNKPDADNSQIKRLLDNNSGRIVLKGSRGQVGREVEVVECRNCAPQELLNKMKICKYDLVEEYVIQHHDLMALSPSGLNTIRIFTQLSESSVEILGARLRISVNSPVDNLGAGNLAAPVDIVTGRVTGPAVFSDISKSDCTEHPVTGIRILDFQVPYWKEVLTMVKQAALLYPENRSIGWDIAITEDGPELIEGNHNWCKLLWQLPVKRGMKKELEKYL